MTGMIHLYWGNGKGKTTAAVGLALRALGAGKSVTLLQFLKGEETGEITMLKDLGVKIYRGKSGMKFVRQMTEEDKQQTLIMQNNNLRLSVSERSDFLIIDEACAAWQMDLVDHTLLREAVMNKPEEQELVMTGRNPAEWMKEIADYSTEMVCHRHPYEKGIKARKGVEY